MICDSCEKLIGEHETHIVDYVYYTVDGWIESYYCINCLKTIIRGEHK